MTETKNTAKNMSNLSSEQKIWGAVGYLWILSLVALTARKNDEFVRFHASQGVLLFVVSIVGIVLGPLGMILNIILTIGAVVGIIKAWQGEKWPMPIIGGFAKSFGDWLIKTLKL